MPPILSSSIAADAETVAPGTVLRLRNEQPDDVLHLVQGRVVLCVRDGEQQIRHQLGVVEGPFWLDAASAMLGQPCIVDMVAETRVQVRRQSLEQFRIALEALPRTAQLLLQDMAVGYQQQTELAVSRLSQDAEARCAQWLLRHAQNDASGSMSVTLHQRKRMIAAQLGIAPETFSRVLRSLREHGLIHGSGNVLKLPKPQALELVAGF
ncbi:MAG: Crp/Fnr family transcriptional regulator [Giesbergeria sp.]